MNKIYKFLSLAMLLSLATTAHAHDFEVDGIFYNITSKKDLTVEVTYRGDDYDSYSNEYSKAVTIPPSVIHDEKTYSVTRIGTWAFYWCRGLTSITIPSSVASIGNSAFYNCRGLTSITIPSSVTSIGNKAFSCCDGLTSVNILKGVTTIGDEAFSNCGGLTSVTIPSSVTTIGSRAFDQCVRLTSITIPSSVTTIGGHAFYGCGLTSVHISDIPAWCNITFETAYANPLSFAEHLFLGDDEVTELVIPEGVTSIGPFAFYGCSGLTSITIPSSVTSIGNKAFYWCRGLTSIKVDAGNSVYDSRADCNAIIQTATNTIVQGCQTTIFPRSVTSIGDDAFSYCDGLTSVTIPSSVTTIGSRAFYGCGLTSVTILEGVTSIGTNAFCRCRSLTSVTIPSSVTKIGDDAFSECPNLTFEGGTFTFLMAHLFGLRGAEQFEKVSSHTASSIRLGFYPFDENTHVYSFTVNGKEMLSGDYSITMLGLQPNNHYSFQYVVRTNARTFSFTKQHYTANLNLKAKQPKVISVGNVVVSAESNLDDAEENVGFEWRRTDWTDDFASNTGEAYLFDGMMEGYIRNLYAEKLWKYRPYYEAGDGTRYYGDWVGIDPANTSYFEPTVHTYATVEVKGRTATVKGYVQRGTDDVAEQGFAYWKTEAGAKGREDVRRISSIPDDATTVVARGKVMTATLTGLEAGTEYTYVAYVITDEGETFYGEEQTFHTDVATGIEETTAAPVQRAVPQGVFNLSGQRLSAPQKGLNIINGKKVLVK